MVGLSRAREHRLRTLLLAAATVFAIVLMLFIVTYVIAPQFSRTSVRLPASCDGFDGQFSPPSHLAYTVPDAGPGILLANDERSAVVAVIDYRSPPFPTTVFLVNRSDGGILRRMGFDNDVVSGTIVGGIAYLFNDKLGYLINAHTGEFEQRILVIDNYGGLSETDRPIISRGSDGHWYMETTAVISSWHVDGTVRSRPSLTFNAIARGCYISGDTNEVTRLY
jgi:hypothetical protein